MEGQKSSQIIPLQLTKNYFRKGVKAKGMRRVFEALVDLKENYVISRFKSLRAREKLAKTELLKKIKKKFKRKLKLKKLKTKRFKKKKRLIFRSKVKSRIKNKSIVSLRKVDRSVIDLNPKSKKTKINKIKKKNRILKDGCFATWVLKQAVSNCCWRIFLRNRWVAGKRMKVPFFTTFARDVRYACKNFMKSITDKEQTPFLPGFLKELYLSLVLRSITVKKRVLAYKTLYATTLYTSGNFKTIRRRKRINRY
jgi:ribosomal protein S7